MKRDLYIIIVSFVIGAYVQTVNTMNRDLLDKIDMQNVGTPYQTKFPHITELRPCSAKDVAKFFVLESNEYIYYSKTFQKMLYMAQGYYLGLVGMPLFEEEITAGNDYPFLTATSDMEGYFAQRLNPAKFDSNPLKKKREPLESQPDPEDPEGKKPEEAHRAVWKATSEREKEKAVDEGLYERLRNYEVHLRVILKLDKAWWTNWKGGKPFEDVSKDQVISKDSMKQYFRTIKFWCDYMATYLETYASQLPSMFRYMRQFISLSSVKDIAAMVPFFEGNEKLFAAIRNEAYLLKGMTVPLSNAPDIRSLFMQVLFFPIQFEQLAENSLKLYARKNIQELLTISARHGHALALVHCAHVLGTYDEESDPELFETPLEAAGKYFGKTTLQELLRVIEVDTPIGSHYLQGLLLLSIEKFQEADNLFEKGTAMGEPWCVFRFLCDGGDENDLKDGILAKWKNENPGLYAFAGARLKRSTEEKVKLYVKAAAAGMVQGLKYAAVTQHKNKMGEASDHTKLLKKAADLGMVSAYEEWASWEKEDDQKKKIYELYVQTEDLAARRLFGDFLLRQGKRDEALQEYSRAELSGYELILALTTDSQKSEIRVKLLKQKQAVFERLHKNASKPKES